MRIFSSIEIPQNGEREYFRAFGIHALFVAASPAGAPCRVGETRDLASSLAGIRSRWHPAVSLVAAWWLKDAAKARAIVAAVADSDAHADVIAGEIEAAAAAVGAKLTPHAAALRDVRIAAAHVDAVIEQASAAGELKWFNRKYKAWRIAVGPEVAAALPYGLARARLRAAAVRGYARGEFRIGPELWAEVLPATAPAGEDKRPSGMLPRPAGPTLTMEPPP